MGQDAELLGTGARERHFEDAIVDIAVPQTEVLGHGLDKSAEGEDRRVFMRRGLVVANSGKGHHLFDIRDDDVEVAQAVVEAEETADVG